MSRWNTFNVVTMETQTFCFMKGPAPSSHIFIENMYTVNNNNDNRIKSDSMPLRTSVISWQLCVILKKFVYCFN